MKTISPRSGHELTQEEASRGGRNQRRGRSWKTVYEELLDCEPTEKMKMRLESMGLGKISDLTWQKSIAAAMMAKAREGDVQAAKLITQTMEDQVGDAERPHKISVTIKRV